LIAAQILRTSSDAVLMSAVFCPVVGHHQLLDCAHGQTCSNMAGRKWCSTAIFILPLLPCESALQLAAPFLLLHFGVAYAAGLCVSVLACNHDLEP
jgi:hypothetical protein